MFTLVVRFDLPDATAAAAFDALVAGAVPLIHTEPGTLVYDTYTVEDEPLARVFFEVYRDAEAHAAHEQQPHTVEFLTRVRAIVDSIRVEQLTGPPRLESADEPEAPS